MRLLTNFICSLLVLLLISTITLQHAGDYTQESVLFGADVNSPDLIFVHLVPHSHTDSGWTDNFENYYNGSAGNCVKCMLNDLVVSLNDNPTFRFAYPEMIYLEKWWRDDSVTAENKRLLKQAVARGQLDLISAHSVMNDEAITYYDDIIDQMLIGHRFADKELGFKPHIGWSIDPYGHSSSQGRLLTEMGFDSLFLERTDTSKDSSDDRKYKRQMQFIWDVSVKQDGSAKLFSHINYTPYEKYPVNCNTIFCNPSREEEAKQAELFVNYIKEKQIQTYRTRHIFYQLGGLFSWTNHGDIKNLYYRLERVMKYFNEEHPEHKLRLVYSTPALYLESLKNESKVQSLTEIPAADYPKFNGEFLPYQTQDPWTGYFSARPWFKTLSKQVSRRLLSARVLFTKLNMMSEYANVFNFTAALENLRQLEHAMALAQHHDAITGIAVNVVFNYYNKVLSEALNETNNQIYSLTKALTAENATTDYFECTLNETNACTALKSDQSKQSSKLLLTIFNPGEYGWYPVRIKVPSSYHRVKFVHSHGRHTLVEYDIVCYEDCELTFVDEFQAKQFVSYYIIPDNSGAMNSANMDAHSTEDVVKLSSPSNINFTALSYHPKINTFEYIRCKGNTDPNRIWSNRPKRNPKPAENDNKAPPPPEQSCMRHNFSMSYSSYISRTRDSHLLRAGRENRYLENATKPEILYYSGTVHSELVFKYPNVTTRIRFWYRAVDYGIEIETYLPSFIYPMKESLNDVLRIKSHSIENKGYWYSDHNGLEMKKRYFVLNEEAPYERAKEYVGLTTAIKIKDEVTEESMTIMVDQPEGGISQREGTLEVMVNRHLPRVQKSEIWLDELLEDSTIAVRVKNRLLFANKDFPSAQRKLQIAVDYPLIPMLRFMDSQDIFDESALVCNSRPIINDNIKVVVIPQEKQNLLLRVQNMNEDSPMNISWMREVQNGDTEMNSIPLLDSFLCGIRAVKVTNIREVSLTAVFYKNSAATTSHLILNPLEIRTFVVDYQPTGSKRELKKTEQLQNVGYHMGSYGMNLFPITLTITISLFLIMMF